MMSFSQNTNSFLNNMLSERSDDYFNHPFFGGSIMDFRTFIESTLTNNCKDFGAVITKQKHLGLMARFIREIKVNPRHWVSFYDNFLVNKSTGLSILFDKDNAYLVCTVKNISDGMSDVEILNVCRNVIDQDIPIVGSRIANAIITCTFDLGPVKSRDKLMLSNSIDMYIFGEHYKDDQPSEINLKRGKAIPLFTKDSAKNYHIEQFSRFLDSKNIDTGSLRINFLESFANLGDMEHEGMMVLSSDQVLIFGKKYKKRIQPCIAYINFNWNSGINDIDFNKLVTSGV